MKLRLLDRYVLSELLYPFIFGVAAFSSIFIASSLLFKIIQYMTNYGASGAMVARLFVYSLPEVINYTFPMSMLLASLMAFGKLSGSSEIVAMKSGGISFYRIVAPVMVVGLIVSLFSTIWAEKVVPPAKTEASRIIREDIKGRLSPKTQDHIVIKTISGNTQRVTYARHFDQKSGILEDVTVEEMENGKLVRVQMGKQAKWVMNTWELEDGTIFNMDDKEGVTSKATFTKQVIPLRMDPKEVLWQDKDVDQMTISELRGLIRIQKRQGERYSDAQTEIYLRFAIPLASLFFAILGAALGTQKQRTSSSIGLGISILVIFMYYAIMAFTTGLGRGGKLWPPLAAFAADIISFAVGMYLLKKRNY